MLLRIADLCLRMTLRAPPGAVRLAKEYEPFRSSGRPDVLIHAAYGRLPDLSLPLRAVAFDSGATWAIWRSGSSHVLVLRGEPPGSSAYAMAVFDRTFHRIRVDFSLEAARRSGRGFLPHPLDFPMGPLLLGHIMARKGGLLLHACGIADGDQGYLFAGHSGHGKSTMARLWEGAARICNDDRVVVRRRGKHLYLYGTPWHGDHASVSAEGVRLSKVFFLRHAARNTVTPCTGMRGAAMLLARCFLPAWDRPGLARVLAAAEDIATSVPCRELGFFPDKRVLDVVRCAT